MLALENCAQAELLAKAWLQDNPVLEKKVRRALLCNRPEAHTAVAECVKFLTLVAHNETGVLTPSHRVDLVWHELILFTKSYAEFCITNFQKFIHHQPSEDTVSNGQQFERTLLAYQARFGDPPAEFWGNRTTALAACGNCETTND